MALLELSQFETESDQQTTATSRYIGRKWKEKKAKRTNSCAEPNKNKFEKVKNVQQGLT